MITIISLFSVVFTIVDYLFSSIFMTIYFNDLYHACVVHNCAAKENVPVTVFEADNRCIFIIY